MKIITFILILALASLACGFSIPKAATPGPDVTDTIALAYPDAENTSLALAFGAGEMTLNPGAEGLVEGTATYNYPAFKPVSSTTGGSVHLGLQTQINAFPGAQKLKNNWDLKLGAKPMDLSIESGAYKGIFELGGLALKNLTIKDGAADVKLSFSKPNETEMAVFHYETGASNVKMSGLANANFGLLDFTSGAGDYTLDFSGSLQRDASVTISSGLSNVILIIPEGVHAVVDVESGASNISAAPGWTQNGRIYTQAGEGPTLTISISIGAGNVTLTH